MAVKYVVVEKGNPGNPAAPKKCNVDTLKTSRRFGKILITFFAKRFDVFGNPLRHTHI